MTAEREGFEVGQNELVTLNLNHISLPNGVSSLGPQRLYVQ